MSIQFLVIMVPVLLGFMGFAIDLGRMYLVRGELNQAASAMAVAAASRLNGTDAAIGLNPVANLSDANTFNFGSLPVGQTNGVLDSVVEDPSYFAEAVEAINAVGQTGTASTADGTSAHHVTINLSGEAPLVFWSLLALGQTRKTKIAGAAAAGFSAPVCTACGIEPFAIQPLNPDAPEFGFDRGSTYTFYYQCTGRPPGTLAPGTAGLISYQLLDRFASGIALTDFQLQFRNGAQGLRPASSDTGTGQACSTIGTTEKTVSVTVQACVGPVSSPQLLTSALCGLNARITTPPIQACTDLVADPDSLVGTFTPDSITPFADFSDYSSNYAGDNKRLMTLPVVDSALTVLGFRQFLLQPTATNNPADINGRFAAMYLGIVAPVKSGSVGGSCGVARGPGKVVLHR